MRISVCVPFYNEASIIKNTAIQLQSFLVDHFCEEFELLFIDDGSTDGSSRILSSLELSGIKVLSCPSNRGKGAAVREGMLSASGDISIFLDADLAYGVDVILQFYNQMTNHSEIDVLIGSRTIHPDGYKGYTFLRRLASKTLITVLQHIGNFPFSDSQCGCKAFRTEARKAIFSRCKSDGFEFDFEVLLLADKLGYSIQEFPVQIINHRRSKVFLGRDAPKMLLGFIKIKRRINSLEAPPKQAV